MASNINGTADVIRLIEKTWTSIWGMLLAWGIILFATISWNSSHLVAWRYVIAFDLFMLPTIFLIWTITTKRWFQLTGYWVLLHYFCIITIGACFCFLIYPFLIKGTKCDIQYIQYWGTILIVLLLFWISYLYIRKKHEGLCIVFLVSNQSKYENDILQSLKRAQERVCEQASNIKIIIPPFGIANSYEDCNRYINGHFNQADAVIYASLIDSPVNSEFGYAFTGFTSRMSDRFVKLDSTEEARVKFLMDESYRCHEWNTLNISTDQISRHLEVAENLTHLFLMYVSCIYLHKHKFTDAIDVAEGLYTYSSTGNDRYDHAVKDLIAHSYVTAEQIEEHENQNYAHAHEILDTCVQKLPHVRFTLIYILAMARLYFYEGNIKESKRYTKKAKDAFRGSEWYVAVNMAFYAIVEQKPKEVLTFYKKMLKLQKPYRDEVEFSIRFQMIELEKTTNYAYKLFLLHGLAFLNLYIDENKTDQYLRMIDSYAAVVGYAELEDMRSLIKSN